MQDAICQAWADSGRNEPGADVKLPLDGTVLILDSDAAHGQ